MKSSLLLLLIWCLYFPYYAQTDKETWSRNTEEYYRAIGDLEKSIWSIKGYIIDTAGDHWTAIDPRGFFSFEGLKRKPDDSYLVRIKGYIYSSDYFKSAPIIKCIFTRHIDYLQDKKEQDTFQINCFSDAFEDDYPFKLQDIEVAYVEKVIYLMPSKVLVFDRFVINETYTVTFKDKMVRTYELDQRHGKYYEIK